MTRSLVSAWVVMVVLTHPAVGAAAPVVLQKPRDYPHAGISLASPKGYEDRPLSNPYDVMNAVILVSNRPVQGVTLSAFPVAEEVTAEAYADIKMAELKSNLAIRHLKLLKKTAMPVAGLTGSARLMSYTFRGMKTLAAQVYFIRDVKNTKVRICYLLTVVCSADRQPMLLPTLGAVIRSARLTAVRHPDLSDPGEMGEPIQDPDLGYSLRPPRRWYAVRSDVRLEMGQVDYLLKGVQMPTMHVLVHTASRDAATSEAQSKEHIAIARSLAAKQKRTCEVISEGPVKLAGLPAYQFVLVHSAKQETPLPRSALPPGSVVTVQRTLCVAGAGAPLPRAYVLALTARGEDAKAAGALMDRLAAGFSLIGPASQPATAPTTKPTTRPAAKPPASAPATRPAATAPTR